MKLILATLFLSASFADLISNESGQTLKCYTSHGWKIFDKSNLEKEHCSSRCYAAATHLDDGHEMAKLGCDINDYEETMLNPLMNRIQKAEDLMGKVYNLEIDEQKLVAEAKVGKPTIEKIKSREKLFLNGSVGLEIDEFELDLNFKGLIDLMNPIFSYPNVNSGLKVCFGNPEICHDILLGNSWFFTWFLSKMLIEKEARIVIDQLELKLSIKGDLGSVLAKILREEKFQAALDFQMFSYESYGWVYYKGTTSTSKFSTMIEDMSKYSILEYFYSKADDIAASICADNKCFFAKGCSENLCNYI